MRPSVSIIILIQAVITASVVAMSIWAGMPWPGTFGLGLLGVAAMATATPLARQERVQRWALSTAWACTLIVLAGAVLPRSARVTLANYFDSYFVVLAWMVVAAILPASRRCLEGALGTWWRLLLMAWAIMGSLLWLVATYLRNQPGTFYIGLVVILALLILCHLWFRLPALAILTVNTLILLFLGLPLADLLTRCADSLRAQPDSRQQAYLYAAAKNHPAAFGRWWNYYIAQWQQAEKTIYVADPDPVLTFRLRPNSRARLAQSELAINSHGFRGREIRTEKGAAYRIVALGESTTFGITFNADDRPWPELLEQMIRERLRPSRPVEVINAGIPGYRLDQNLHRLRTEIMALKPDMVISYHGINGFGMLNGAVAALPGRRPPAYEERPLRLLANLEFRLRMIRFVHHRPPGYIRRPAPISDPLTTGYAQFYIQLAQVAQANRIRLVLANYSMAVNDRSALELVEFYRMAYPSAPWQILANLVHTGIVQKIAAQHPEVCFVDTHPHLDGEHDKFIDLVHFAPAGDQQLAENFFAALRPILEEDLSRL
jgi:lysophospholipase L1-like esterase